MRSKGKEARTHLSKMLVELKIIHDCTITYKKQYTCSAVISTTKAAVQNKAGYNSYHNIKKNKQACM